MHNPTRKIVLASLALALAIPAFLFAAAAAPGAEGWGDHGHFLQHMAKQLNLTADQQTKIKAVFAAHKADLATQMTQLHQARTQLSSAIHADTFDESAIRTASQGVAAAEAELAVIHGKIANEARQILTPDQQVKAKELMAQHQQKAEQRFTHMQQHMQGAPSDTPQN